VGLLVSRPLVCGAFSPCTSHANSIRADKVVQALVKAGKKYLQKKIQTQVFNINTLRSPYLKTYVLKKDTLQKALVKFGPRYAQQMGCCCFVPPGFA
jgi:hypothetical protein